MRFVLFYFTFYFVLSGFNNSVCFRRAGVDCCEQEFPCKTVEESFDEISWDAPSGRRLFTQSSNCNAAMIAPCIFPYDEWFQLFRAVGISLDDTVLTEPTY